MKVVVMVVVVSFWDAFIEGITRLISHAAREVRSRITAFIELLLLCAAIKVDRSAQNPEIAVLVYSSACISSSLCRPLRSPFSVSLSNLSYLLCEWWMLPVQVPLH